MLENWQQLREVLLQPILYSGPGEVEMVAYHLDAIVDTTDAATSSTSSLTSLTFQAAPVAVASPTFKVLVSSSMRAR